MSNKQDLFNEIKNKVASANPDTDRGIVNPVSKTSFVVSDDGNTNMSAGDYAQYKLDKQSGQSTEYTLKSTTTTVQKELNATDIIVNKHKFNNQFVDLTDFKQVGDNVLGGIMVNGTVLVKTWEHTLQKWVLVRRNISTPMFSNRLNIPSTPEQMEVDLNAIKDIKEYYIEQTKNNTEN